jgi:hypothetical protein
MSYALNVTHLTDPDFLKVFDAEFEVLRNLHPSDIAEVLE